MSDAIKISRITNAKVYLNGNSMLGRAEEIELPQIKFKMADHKAVGLVGEAEFFAGIEKLEAKIKWTSFYSDVLKLLGNPTQTVQVQVRGSITNWGGQGVTSEVPLVCMMTLASKEFPMGKFAKNENVELETAHACYYVKMTIDGEDILEIDVLANIYKVNGEDILAQYRQNIGG